ncbi:MAG TPA: SAV_6107 family HEPN domain-containing protein [Cryptosporangiaceae bacterium]|nr:SAV_6107 family HEPN domain-containing protein [Cryptosporangiaceae bacterium]
MNTTAPARQARAGTGAQDREALVGVPAYALPHRSPRELLALAGQGLTEATLTGPAGSRYALAHLAALRAAAAVLAARARPDPTRRRRGRQASVWVLLAQVAPELREWAAFFATAAVKRAAAEAGIPRVVTDREADDLVRDAQRFCEVVTTTLGASHQQSLDLTVPRAG